jgi:hypothetical protein
MIDIDQSDVSKMTLTALKIFRASEDGDPDPYAKYSDESTLGVVGVGVGMHNLLKILLDDFEQMSGVSKDQGYEAIEEHFSD